MLGDPAHAELIALGIAHEQQHQELLLSDIKHAFFQNPLGPAMWPDVPRKTPPHGGEIEWHDHPGGIALVGHAGNGFAFDNEGPKHRVLLEPFALAGRLVRNGEWEQFMLDGGYTTASLWLSDGWDWVRRKRIEAPEYWYDGEHFTHSGWQTRDPWAPVTHISYYEADAFATWAGARLPTEFEWEAIAQGHDPLSGNQLDIAAPPLPAGALVIVRRLLAMDALGLSPVSALRPGGRRGGRVQRQVHVGAVRAQGRELRDGARSFPRQLPQFLLPAPALAVHRPAAGEGSLR